MSTIRVLYDGWPLAYAPNRAAALHLETILSVLPPEVGAVVALPAAAPVWQPGEFETLTAPEQNTAKGQRRWQQRVLPRIAQEQGAALLHTTAARAPLMSGASVVVSPSGYGDEDRQGEGVSARLGFALGQGGLARAEAVLWPEDLPDPDWPANLHRLPPLVHPAFTPGLPDELPDIPELRDLDSFVLYHGPDGVEALARTLQSWSWAAGAIGSFYPLLMAGMDGQAQALAKTMLEKYEVSGSVQILPPLPVETLARLYRAALALLHPAEASPWGGAMRHAIACGRPVVSFETPRIDALAGPAAFLVTENTPKLFGSGVIAMSVKEEVAIGLEQAAKQRAAPWRSSEYAERLLSVYRDVL